jgi:hypothetical protein
MNTLERTSAILRSTATVLAIAVLASACTIDKKKLESAITDECKAKGITLKSVDCPADRKAKKGDTFDCKGETEDGDKVVFHVTQSDGGGNIEWKLDGQILNQAKVGDSLEKAIDEKAHVKADVKCPEKTIILLQGKSFKCDATVDDKTKKVEITLGEGDSYSWKVQE